MEAIMRQFRFGALGASLAALLLSLALVGCSKDKDQDEEGSVENKPKAKKPGSPGGGGPEKSNVRFVEGKGTTTIKGKVLVKGGDVEGVEKQLTKSLQGEMAKKDTDVCMAGDPSETTEQAYRIGDNKQVGNVFVWIAPSEPNMYFKVDPKLVEEAAKHAVTIDQPHCAFVPHVAVYFPVYRDPKDPKQPTPTGQKFIVKNDAPISHNTLAVGGSKNPEQGGTIGKGGENKSIKLIPDSKEVMIKCNIHPWMNGYVRVFDHPFATVTKSDTAPKELKVDKKSAEFGTFAIKDAPAGVKVRLFAWHEKGEYLTPPEGIEIDTKEGETTVKDLEMEVKP
jgi:hypothetical protein